MERTVPKTATEEIDLYLRTVYSLLRSTTEIQIRTLEEVHAGMSSLLHPDARHDSPDAAAFIYSILRLPECMAKVRLVILGQSSAVFAQHGLSDVESWQPVSAKARRRRCYFDGKDQLGCFIASRTDIEDVLPSMTAYQIEWNKLHFLMQKLPADFNFEDILLSTQAFSTLASYLDLAEEDLQRLGIIWEADFIKNLKLIKNHRCAFRVNLLTGSLTEYWRATRAWWENIERSYPDLLKHPVYFVSSNTHSITNLLTGFAFRKKETLMAFLEEEGDEKLKYEWQQIQNSESRVNLENYLYYLLKKAQQTPGWAYLKKEQRQYEKELGIIRIASKHYFDVDAQVIPLNRLNVDELDPRLLNHSDLSVLKSSDALILNIDYPLGLAAYNILTKVAEHVSPVLGVYMMGKAATLNGVLGDVMIPNVVHDEHSKNTYMFKNAFSAKDVSEDLLYGTVMDNQKAVTVLGTFLQNGKLAEVFYREGYSDIEMEAGPFLSAVYEMYRPTRHPVNEIVNLYGLPFDLGVVHYASDTPLSKGKNLGAGTLSYLGMDSTYAASLAILRRIFKMEKHRLSDDPRKGCD